MLYRTIERLPVNQVNTVVLVKRKESVMNLGKGSVGGGGGSRPLIFSRRETLFAKIIFGRCSLSSHPPTPPLLYLKV